MIACWKDYLLEGLLDGRMLFGLHVLEQQSAKVLPAQFLALLVLSLHMAKL